MAALNARGEAQTGVCTQPLPAMKLCPLWQETRPATCASGIVAHAVPETLNGGVVVVLVTVTVMQFLSGPLWPGGIWTVTSPLKLVSPVCGQANDTLVGGAPLQKTGATVPGHVTGVLFKVNWSDMATEEPAGILVRLTLMVKVQGFVDPPFADDVQVLSSAPGFLRFLETFRKQ